MPVSTTSMTMPSPRSSSLRLSATTTEPPPSVYLIALEIGLSSTCRMRSQSATAGSRSGISVRTTMLLRSADGPAASTASATTSTRSTGAGCRRRLPSETSLTSSRSANRACSLWACRCTTRMCAAASSSRSSRSSSSFEVAQHRGQRRPQLVRDRGHELVLDLDRPDQLGDLLVGERRAPRLPRRPPHLSRERGVGLPGRGIAADPVGVVVELLALDGAVRRHLLPRHPPLAVEARPARSGAPARRAPGRCPGRPGA
ncbi:hypothetical protein HIDPHFAB_02044 [Nocardioides sp. T2.26MG-1]|nr:hypothetical protein HIDPHFAB_02044 [Nocardioides sp. T2.26MG-1]